MLRIDTDSLGNMAILRCEGRIVAGDEVNRLKSAVLCHQDRQIIVLDLEKVEMIDGSGLGLLAFLAGWSRIMGTEVKLANPSRRVRDLLRLTRLDSVLEISTAEEVSHLPAPVAESCIEHGIFMHAH